HAAPNRPAANIINSDAQREPQFYRNSLAAFVANNEQLLTAEQRNECNKINATGGTYLISLILASIRSQNHITLAIRYCSHPT
ncbi:unnamed protein product, partial [Ceratitis capitata]